MNKQIIQQKTHTGEARNIFAAQQLFLLTIFPTSVPFIYLFFTLNFLVLLKVTLEICRIFFEGFVWLFFNINKINIKCVEGKSL